MNRLSQQRYYRTPDDDYVFDEYGNLVRVDKKWWLPDRAIVENSRTGNRSQYNFSDSMADVQQLKAGIITGIVFVSASRIEKMIAASGALDKANRADAKNYLLKEGKGGGKLDFSYTAIPLEFSADGASNDPLRSPSPILFAPEGMVRVENHMNFGNFLFGVAGYALGASQMALLMGAHYNSVVNSNENGYVPQIDSPDDQHSISAGVRFAKTHRLRYKEHTVANGVSTNNSRAPRKL